MDERCRTGEFEDHRRVLHDFLLNVLQVLKPNGVWLAPDPAPMSAGEVEFIFEAVREDPRYSRQSFTTRTDDGMVVSMLNGLITIEPEGSHE